VEVYYQHQLRMSLKARGEQLVGRLFDYFAGEGKMLLPEDCRPEVFNGHLRMRRVGEGAPASSGGPFVADSVEKLSSAYTDNVLLGLVGVQVLRAGGVLSGVVREVHNNHLHVIYIFLVC
jgi:hypothetical protein